MCFKYFVYYYNEMKEDMLTAQGILVETDLLACVKALQDYYGDRTALALSRKYVCWYCKGLHNAKKFREQYVKTADFNTAYKVIDDYFNFDGEVNR